jgi:hypothetical protein
MGCIKTKAMTKNKKLYIYKGFFLNRQNLLKDNSSTKSERNYRGNVYLQRIKKVKSDVLIFDGIKSIFKPIVKYNFS